MHTLFNTRVGGQGKREGEMRGREGGEEEEGEEGAGGGRRGGGRRGGGRREKRRKKGGRGKEENFARAKRAPLQKGGGRRGGGRGEVRGWEGGEAYPPVHPLIQGVNIQLFHGYAGNSQTIVPR